VKMEPEKAEAPTTVESLEADPYVVDIKSKENPFAKTSNYDTDVCCGHKYQSTKSRRMLHTANEKKR